jgi:hypothetical protein
MRRGRAGNFRGKGEAHGATYSEVEEQVLDSEFNADIDLDMD